MTKQLLSFHNDPKLKKRYLKRMMDHAKADEIIQGKYWENGKGCATGCLMHSVDPHELYPTRLGIPEIIAYLEDRIFEGLSNKEESIKVAGYIEAAARAARATWAAETAWAAEAAEAAARAARATWAAETAAEATWPASLTTDSITHYQKMRDKLLQLLREA